MYPPPAGVTSIIGLEVSGTVAHVAPDCQLGFKIGDRVCALLPGGGYAEFAAVDERHVLPVPPSLSFAEAAAVPEARVTPSDSHCSLRRRRG